jgi:hypothetical protein
MDLRYGPTQFMLNNGPCTEARGECHTSPGNLPGGKYPLNLGSLRVIDHWLHSLIDTSFGLRMVRPTTEICGIADRARTRGPETTMATGNPTSLPCHHVECIGALGNTFSSLPHICAVLCPSGSRASRGRRPEFAARGYGVCRMS